MDGLLIVFTVNVSGRRFTIVMVTCSLALFTAGCSQSPSSEIEGQGLSTYEASPGDGGDSALLEGTLMDAGGCLYVETPEGQSVIPILPAGQVSWDGQVLEIDQRAVEKQTVEVGGSISVGGGYRTGGVSDYPVPEDCPDDFEHFQVASP